MPSHCLVRGLSPVMVSPIRYAMSLVSWKVPHLNAELLEDLVLELGVVTDLDYLLVLKDTSEPAVCVGFRNVVSPTVLPRR